MRICIVVCFSILMSVAASAEPAANPLQKLEQAFRSTYGESRTDLPDWVVKDLPGRWAQTPLGFATAEERKRYADKRCAGFSFDIEKPRDALPVFQAARNRTDGAQRTVLAWVGHNRFLQLTALEDDINEVRPSILEGVGDERFSFSLYKGIVSNTQREVTLTRFTADLLVIDYVGSVAGHSFLMRCATAGGVSSEAANQAQTSAIDISRRALMFKRAVDGSVPFLKLLEGSWTLMIMFGAQVFEQPNPPSAADLCKKSKVDVTAPYPQLPLLTVTTTVHSDDTPFPKRNFELRFAADGELLMVPETDRIDIAKSNPGEHALPQLSENALDPLSQRSDADIAAIAERNDRIRVWRNVAHGASMPIEFTVIDNDLLIESSGPDTRRGGAFAAADRTGILWLRCPAN
jgi:hypothetical protein